LGAGRATGAATGTGASLAVELVGAGVSDKVNEANNSDVEDCGCSSDSFKPANNDDPVLDPLGGASSIVSFNWKTSVPLLEECIEGESCGEGSVKGRDWP